MDRGSSPRMRGTQDMAYTIDLGKGIIPAYAGNTIVIQVLNLFAWDHPRVCGEHHVQAQSTFSTPGSSPRMRGTRVRRCCGVAASGIIPAYAGNTRY